MRTMVCQPNPDSPSRANTARKMRKESLIGMDLRTSQATNVRLLTPTQGLF